MSNVIKQRRVLTSKQEILDYLSISDKLFKKFILSGMPALFIEGRWYAHSDNIDQWFLVLTKKSHRGIDPEDSFSPAEG